MREFLVRIGRVERAGRSDARPEAPGSARAWSRCTRSRGSRARRWATGVPPVLLLPLHGRRGSRHPRYRRQCAHVRPHRPPVDIAHRAQMQTYAEKAADPHYFFQGKGADLKVRCWRRPSGRRPQSLPPVSSSRHRRRRAPPAESRTCQQPATPSRATDRRAGCPRGRGTAGTGQTGIRGKFRRRHRSQGAASEHSADADGAGGRRARHLVGVIDTGIDGTHPAFAGRIHAVWDQRRLARTHRDHWRQFRAVLTGADIATIRSTSPDMAPTGGHRGRRGDPARLHKTGIAPGRGSSSSGDRDFSDANIIAGARWIFQQARRPAVRA